MVSLMWFSQEKNLKRVNPILEFYLTALQHLNVEANQALIIEDSEKGIAAGVAAGVEVWAIKDNRFGMDQRCSQRLVG